MSQLFTQNEREILEQLRHQGASDLASLAIACGLARSSVHTALQRLIEMGVVENAQSSGKALYRMRGRDALERATQQIAAAFKEAVFPLSTTSAEKAKLVFTDNYVLPEPQLQELRSFYNVVTFPDSHAYISDDVFAERSQDADIIVRYDEQPITREFLAGTQKLKAVVFPNCVVANVDREACEEFGVRLFYPDPMTHMYYATSQVEYLLNAMFTLIKPLSALGYQLDSVDNYYDWRRNIGQDVYGKKVGVIFEHGSVRTLIQMLQLFGCDVRAASTAAVPLLASELGLAGYSSVDDVWDWAEVVAIHSGTSMNLERFLHTKGPDYLIVGSGGLEFDPRSMANFVADGNLKGLAIDMLPHSWNANESQEMFEQAIEPLRHLPNVIITSEAGVFSTEAISRSHARVFDILMSLDLRAA